ncbi:circular bacteriocin, circularin A/uberolysin family [Lachnospiraceae bacterium 54-53]
MNTNIKEHKILNMLSIMAIGLLCIGFLILSANIIPVANLVKEFGIPAAAAGTILDALDAGATAATIASIVAGLATGGLSLIAAAGKSTVKAYLKKQIKKKGRKAVIAW